MGSRRTWTGRARTSRACLVLLLLLAVGGVLRGGPTGVALDRAPATAVSTTTARVASAVRVASQQAPAVRPAVATAAGATHVPLPAWAPTAGLPGRPQLLPGQLPRPPTAPLPQQILDAPRGRAPPVSAGT